MARPMLASPLRGLRYNGGRVRIAVDVGVSPKAYDLLENVGIDVIYEAGNGERDEVWFLGALRAGVHAVVSPDIGVALLAYDHFVEWVRLRSGVSGEDHALLILRRLRGLGWLR